MIKKEETQSVVESTKRLSCGCLGGTRFNNPSAAQYQDGKYGVGIRVHNRTKQNAKDSERKWACTVCSRIK